MFSAEHLVCKGKSLGSSPSVADCFAETAMVVTATGPAWEAEAGGPVWERLASETLVQKPANNQLTPKTAPLSLGSRTGKLHQ